MKKRINVTIEENIHKLAVRKHRNFSKYVEKLIIRDIKLEESNYSPAQIRTGVRGISINDAIVETSTTNSAVLLQKGVYNLEFCLSDEYLDFIKLHYTTHHSFIQTKSFFCRNLDGKSFGSPVELINYINLLPAGVKNTVIVARVYLNFLERTGISSELLAPFRAVLKYKRNRADVYVPSDDVVINTFNKLSSSTGQLLYLICATSGIRFVEALEFLKNFDKSKFIVNDNFVSYTIGTTRGYKSTNNVYLPVFVYNKLCHYSAHYESARSLVNLDGEMTIKYLRKWQYNFLLLHGVPESVADFIQGRSGASVAANHYLAKATQATFWYSRVVKDFEELFL